MKSQVPVYLSAVACSLGVAYYCFAQSVFSTAFHIPPQAIVNVQKLTIPPQLPFPQQIHQQVQSLATLGKAGDTAEKMVAAAAGNTKATQAANVDQENLRKALLPYAVGQAKADALVDQGYKLQGLSGKMCKGTNCTAVDPTAAIFFFTKGMQKGAKTSQYVLDDGHGKPTQACPEGESCNICIQDVNVCTVYDATSKFIVDVRNRVVSPSDNGEIAKWIRDPGKDTVSIIQNWRDHVISPQDNGVISKTVRNPIVCITKLFSHC